MKEKYPCLHFQNHSGFGRRRQGYFRDVFSCSVIILHLFIYIQAFINGGFIDLVDVGRIFRAGIVTA